MTKTTAVEDKVFKIKILGRMLEHLGVQMYKKRNTAIAELVANAWDAGATEVHITLPEENLYRREDSTIRIEDNGSGMDEAAIQDKYMIVGRNKRKDGETEIEVGASIDTQIGNGGTVETRKVMGRKGIGKLAGFGIAGEMRLQTWLGARTTDFTMRLNDLKLKENEYKDIKIGYETFDGIPDDVKTKDRHGTRIILSHLKHKSAIEIQSLKESLSRRFSRTVRGQMKIYVNDLLIGEPEFEYKYRFPKDKTGDEFEEAILSDDNKVFYQWGLTKKPIHQTEMRGFTVLVRGKTAQAPNYFFDVEGTATGQHGTKYLVGTIEADYLDEGVDDESDYISTDRQEIDWETDEMKPLYDWGQQLVREALYKNNELAADKFENDVLSNENIKQRIERLGKATKNQIKKMLRVLGKSEPDPERTNDLADALVRIYEYEHFHNSIEEIENIDDPDMLKKLLEHLHQWQTMESMAIWVVIKGRLAVIEKFHQMTVNDAPETANRNLGDNMHDLLGGYPWLLNPEWQVLDEEKTISRQLKQWHYQDIKEEDSRLRYDFIGLEGVGKLLTVEIKRVGYALEIDDLQRLEKYKTRLEMAHTGETKMVIVYGGNANIGERTFESWKLRPDIIFLTWAEIYTKAKNYYEHYRAVLESDIGNPNFLRKDKEVKETRAMLASGKMYRSEEKRKEGLGVQDVNHEKTENG